MSSSQDPKSSRRHDWRSAHRRRSHAESQSEPVVRVDIPHHPLIPRDDAPLLTTDAQLAELLAHVRETRICCYDTEFIGESFYSPRLCLVQIATPSRVAVVDAMAKIDLRPVWELITDAAVLKIVHAGQQDLEPVVRHLGRAPANVFDTQIAAGFVGLPYPLSLTRLTNTVLGVKLGKKLTFTSWDHRPLSEAHLNYAADDVRFGPALHDALMSRLKESGRAAWALEQCAAICDPSLYTPDLVHTALKIRGATSLGKSQAAALYELVALRDELARLHDVPPRSMLRDELLADIARRMPKTVEKLEEIHGMPRPVKADYGARFIQAVLDGQAKGTPPWPMAREHEEAPAEQFRLDALWAVAQSHCRAMGVDPTLVANRAEVAALCRSLIHPHSHAEVPAELTTGWRRELLHDFLRDFIKGQAATLHWQQDRLTRDTK